MKIKSIKIIELKRNWNENLIKLNLIKLNLIK